MPEPTFSIIVPTYNRPDQLATCLQGLAQLDYARARFEVIVVDDASDTSPQHAVAPFRQQLDVHLLVQAHGGPAAARNAGAGVARGRYLAFTDDDCTPAADWLQALESRFAQTPYHAIGGPMLNAYPDNAYAVASQLILDLMFAHCNADPDQARFLASNNLAMPADGFRAIGGFDAAHFPIAAGEDRDICERWLEGGYGIIYAPEVRVFHAHRLTLGSFWRQHLNRGRAVVWIHQARQARGATGFAEEGPVGETLGRAVRALWQGRRRQPPVLAALLVVWRAAHTAGFVGEWLGTRR